MRSRLARASSLVVVTALGVGVSAVLTAVAACSPFETAATALPADSDGGALLDAGPDVVVATEAAADAALEVDAACRDVIGHDFIKEAWSLGGTATHLGNFVVVLTEALPSQGGLAWHAVDLAPQRSFRVSFTLRVTSSDVPASDGVAFFWSGDTSPAIGQLGGGLAFCNGVNGDAVALMTTPVVVDGGPPSASVSVKHSTDTSCAVDGPVATTPPLASTAPSATLSSAFEISLDGPTGKVTVRRDGTTVIDGQTLGYVPGPIRSIGFTGATGNDYAKLEILDLAFTPCP